MEKFDLAPAEWNIMECLWECAPQTGRELTEQLEASMGWSRSTTLTLLRRMVGKGVVTCDTEGTKNTFSPAVRPRGRGACRNRDLFRPRLSGEPEHDGQRHDAQAGHLQGRDRRAL